MPDQTKGQQNVGKIIEIKGVVVDAVFPDELPEINHALRITVPETDGRAEIDLIAEVQQHLGDDRVRAVAMDSTDGVPRGVDVVDTGAPITVPVGDQTLGRIWNVVGDPVDKGDAASGERWPIHREPPAFVDLSAEIEIFETGIKVIDLIAPVHPRRQGRPLRRRRRRQDRPDPGADPQRRPGARRRLRLLGRRRAHARGQRPLARDAGERASSTRSRSATAR